MLGGNVVDVCAVAQIRIAKTRHMMKANFDNAISPCDDAAVQGQELRATARSLTNVRRTVDKHNRLPGAGCVRMALARSLREILMIACCNNIVKRKDVIISRLINCSGNSAPHLRLKSAETRI